MTKKAPYFQLTIPSVYESEIDRRFKLGRRSPSCMRQTQQGLRLSTLVYNKHKLSKLIAKTIKKSRYVLEPAKKRTQLVEGKERILYRSTLTDTIVTAVTAQIMGDYIRPTLSPRVFSYLKGRSSVDVVRDLESYLSDHRSCRPDVKTRGLYVIKRDVTAYGESIPNHPKSRLWSLIETAFENQEGVPAKHPLRSLLHSMVCRDIIDDSGNITTLSVGVPTGSPIQPMLCNLYLTDMDNYLSAIDGGFYARYGDDFIFVHPDAQTAQNVGEFIDQKVEELELLIKPEKKQNLYYTGAGRASDEWKDTKPCASIEHLGCRIGFNGCIGLKKEKARLLQLDIRARIKNVCSLSQTLPQEEIAKAACKVVNQALDPTNILSQRSAELLRHVVNDRAQLKHLDYLIALEIAKGISSQKKVNAFRDVSYKFLRKSGGLTSLVVQRNSYKKRRRGTV